jgi:hypothetical protein
VLTGNKALYHTIAASLPLFFRPWWLDIVCAGTWDAAVVTDQQGAVTAVFPYQLEQKWGLRLLRNPVLTPYLGPYILCTKGMADDAGRWEQEEEQIRLLLEQIPAPAYFQFHSLPGFTAFLPFLHRGFSNTNRITYRMNLRLTEEELLSRMQKRRRRYIRNTDSGLSIRDGMPYVEDFFRLHRQTFEKKRQPYRYDPDLLRRLMEEAAIQQAAHFWAIVADDGQPLGMLWVAYDQDTMYQLLSTFSEGGNPAAVSLLTWHAITEAKKMGLSVFDFEGSIDPGIELFFRKFGGDRHPFLAFEKTSSLLWKIKKALLG